MAIGQPWQLAAVGRSGVVRVVDELDVRQSSDHGETLHLLLTVLAGGLVVSIHHYSAQTSLDRILRLLRTVGDVDEILQVGLSQGRCDALELVSLVLVATTSVETVCNVSGEVAKFGGTKELLLSIDVARRIRVDLDELFKSPIVECIGDIGIGVRLQATIVIGA